MYIYFFWFKGRVKTTPSITRLSPEKTPHQTTKSAQVYLSALLNVVEINQSIQKILETQQSNNKIIFIALENKPKNQA